MSLPQYQVEKATLVSSVDEKAMEIDDFNSTRDSKGKEPISNVKASESASGDSSTTDGARSESSDDGRTSALDTQAGTSQRQPLLSEDVKNR